MGAGALEGLGRALGEISARQADEAAERERMLRQHQRDMELIRLESEMRREEARLAIEERRRQRAAQDRQAKAEVEAAHPGWEQTVRTPQFRTWNSNQIPRVRALAESPEPRDAILLLDLYTRDVAEHRRMIAEVVRLNRGCVSSLERSTTYGRLPAPTREQYCECVEAKSVRFGEELFTVPRENRPTASQASATAQLFADECGNEILVPALRRARAQRPAVRL